MDLLLVIVLALALGFVIGLIAGARRTFGLIVAGRGVRAAGGRLARFMPSQVPTRSAADILAGRIPVLLGGTSYDLKVLPRAPSKRWVEQLDSRFAVLAGNLEQAGNDTPEIMSLLVAETDALYEMLLSYDQDHVLPPRDEIDEVATDAQILHAVLEVWRAAHPLVATTIDSTRSTSGPSSGPPSSLPPSTDGGPTTSSGA